MFCGIIRNLIQINPPITGKRKKEAYFVDKAKPREIPGVMKRFVSIFLRACIS